MPSAQTMSSSPSSNPCLTWETDGYVCALISVRGERHRRQGAPNQDASYGCCGHARGLPYVALAVADGHGGKDYPLSDVGAQLAVNAFGEMAGEFAHYVAELGEVQQGDWRREARRHFESKCGQRLLQIWQARVDAHCAQLARDPAITDEPARRPYGTTVAGVVLIQDLILAGRIGDSCIYQVQLSEMGIQVEPLTEQAEGLGLTTPSLVSPMAHLRWQGAVFAQEESAALVLCTDGFADSFADQGQALISELVEKTGRYGLRWLRERLPQAAELWNREGVADDLTLILCIRRDLLSATHASALPLTSRQSVQQGMAKAGAHDSGNAKNAEADIHQTDPQMGAVPTQRQEG